MKLASTLKAISCDQEGLLAAQLAIHQKACTSTDSGWAQERKVLALHLPLRVEPAASQNSGHAAVVSRQTASYKSVPIEAVRPDVSSVSRGASGAGTRRASRAFTRPQCA